MKALFSQFVLLCKELDLFGSELPDIDGSKLKAVNSTHRSSTKTKLQRRLKAIDEQVEQYLKQWERLDQEYCLYLSG